MSTLTDDDLTRLLGETASSYPVPEHGPDEILAALADTPTAVPVVRRRWVQLSAAATLITAGVLYAGAQSGDGGGSTSSSTGTAAPAGALQYGRVPDSVTPLGDKAALPAPAAARGEAAGSGGQASTVGGGTAGLKAPVPPTLGGTGPVTAPHVAAPATDEGASRVVKSGTIALIVKDKRVTPTLSAVGGAATAEGGYIASSSTDEYGDNPSGEMTIRVPVDHFEKLVARVRGLDAKVRTATMSGKDVTGQYADLSSQLRTLKATRERFLIILSQTKTIGEILTVQQRVDSVSGQIDQIEGQRKLLGSQSDLSTLTVSVSQAGDPVVQVTQKPRSGLAQAFTDAKDGFVNGVEAIIRHSGGFLLFLLCAGAVLLVGRLGWRVARRRMV
jgi:hypothetical protein